MYDLGIRRTSYQVICLEIQHGRYFRINPALVCIPNFKMDRSCLRLIAEDVHEYQVDILVFKIPDIGNTNAFFTPEGTDQVIYIS